MQRILGRYAAYTYAILRIVTGFLFLLHGTQKLFAVPPSPPGMGGGPLNTLMLIGGIIEIVAGLLVMIGFFSSVVAFIASGEMAVAYFMFHQTRAGLPTTNGGDAAVLFCFLFLYIASRGSGVWSVDSIVRNPTPVIST
jgi:putative oxidoreductase